MGRKPIVFAAVFLVSQFFFHPNVVAQIGQKMKAETGPSIIGLWRNSAMGFNMDLNLQQNGKGSFDGEAISYQYAGNTLEITSGSSKTTYQVKLSGDLITLSGGDLDAPVSFNRVNPQAGSSQSKESNSAGSTPAAAEGLVGTWTAQNEEITFTADGKMIYNGVPLAYTQQPDKISVQTPNGNIAFQYTLNGNYLTLRSDGLNAMYTRKTGVTPQAPANGQPRANANQPGEGIIDPALVGKWSYVGTANNISGSFSNEEYVTLKEDGTYEYYSETSGTASGTNMYGDQTFSGGMASQSSDRGTWRVKGNTIIAVSAKTGQKIYQLQKRNHPKTGDPMIILDGTAYVTYYQKAPWR